MNFLGKLSIQMKILSITAVMMAGLVVGLTVKSHLKLSSVFEARIATEQANATATLAFMLRTTLPGVRLNRDLRGTSEAVITWSRIPTELDPRILNATVELTGFDSSIYRFDAGTQEFTRVASTIMNASSAPISGTFLDRNAAYEALMRGEEFDFRGIVEGVEVLAHYRPVYDRTGDRITGAVAMSRNLAAHNATLAEARDVLFTALFAGAILLLSLLAGYLALKRILSPLSEVTQVIESMSHGELGGEIRYSERTDEIGRVASGLQILQGAMRHAASLKRDTEEDVAMNDRKRHEQQIVVDALSSGLARLSRLDLNTQIDSSADTPFPSEYEELRKAFNGLVGQLSDAVTAIQTVAEEVKSDSHEMVSSATDLSTRTESQAATLQESAAALEELSQSVQSTAENAADAEATTVENKMVANQTAGIVEEAITAMQAIEGSSQKITQIISVIDDIAFQTNLLALNAGVEAARAGEAGRGFAVVASEVRALAQHSSASAQEIKTLIAASSQQVKEGSTLVRKAGNSLTDITSRVDRVAGLVSDIAISAKEQSIGVAEINSGVRDLDAATQRNAAMAEEASAASESLTNAAGRLADHLGRFTIAATGRGQKRTTTVAAAPPPQPPNDAEAFKTRASMHSPKRMIATSAVQPAANVFEGF